MRGFTTVVGVLLGAYAGSAALAVEPRTEFEVASVKVSVPPENGRIRVMMGGGPGTPDPGRINYEFVTLRMVLTKAYGLKSYQISGPGWLDSEHFDITAKVPPGTSAERFGVMLQNLVADRFKMTTHREKKELPAYALIVAKGGVKMKVSAPTDPSKDAPLAAGPMPAPGPLKMGKDGYPEMPPGMPGGRVVMMMMPGRMRMMGNGIAVSQLAERLEQQLDKAVVDLTELTGNYDVALTFEPEQNKMMAGMPMGMGRGPGGPEGGDGGPHGSDAEPASNLFTAIQEQLGLKLEPRRIAADLVVIDHLEKTPVEN